MDLSVTRTIAAPIDRVWALQLDHEHWPERLPNFSSVVRQTPSEPFGVGSTVAVTQPGLGTVDWTVTTVDETPTRRTFRWTGTSRRIRYDAGHLVESAADGTTRLTLDLTATGTMISVFGWMLRGPMRKAIAAEAEAFERWAVD